MPFPLIPILAAAASQAVSSMISSGQKSITDLQDWNVYKKKSALNWDYAQKAAAMNDEYQRKLILDTPSLNKAAMHNAGFSVAALNDGFQTASTNATQSPSPGAPGAAPSPVDLLGGLASFNQSQVLAKQAEGIKIDNDIKELQYKKDKREFDEETKEGAFRDEFVRKIKEQESGLDPDDLAHVVSQYEPKYMGESRMRLILGETDNILKSVKNKSQELDLASRKYVFDFNMTQLMDTEEYRDAVTGMTIWQFKKAKEEFKKLTKDNDLLDISLKYMDAKLKNDVDLQKLQLENAKETLRNAKLTNDFNEVLKPIMLKKARADSEFDPKVIMSDIFDGGGSFSDYAKLIVTMIAAFLSSSGDKLVFKAFGMK